VNRAGIRNQGSGFRVKKRFSAEGSGDLLSNFSVIL
jgi:hypothetical protein